MQHAENCMRHKIITEGRERTYALILESGDEPITELQRFCNDYNLTASRFIAIGAFSEVTLGYFDWEKKDYDKIQIDEQVEVLTMAGDVTTFESKPKIHAHVVVGKRDGSAHGGHLLEARVRPTLEIILTEAPAGLRRRMDPESGLPLIDVGGA
jgi:predicted DNA-binding protein with PD1-like motif